MGFEALLAGKSVVCFGAPCYAGWGLTDDRVKVPHRRRKRDLTELFHAFYIWYTIYHLPEGPVPSPIEDVIDYIETHRPARPVPAEVAAEPALSIIIAVHGVEQYLAECLTSIQRQTWQDYEVILIDDASPDRSAEVARGYCGRDPRFRLIRRKDNVGPGFARNQGIDLARGRYILFIDPDDYMPDPNHLSRVLAMAEEDAADMVRYRKCHEQIEDEQGAVQMMRPDETEAFFPEEIRRTSVAQYPQIAHSRHFWNWLYRRDFLIRNNVRFLTTYREERALLLQAYMADPVISICDSNGVVYRIRADSAVRRAQTMSDVNDQLQNFDQVITQLEQKGALVPQSPHWWLAQFQVSQFLHYVYFGFAWKTAKAEAAESQFISQLTRTLRRSGMQPQDLIPDPSQLSQPHLRAGAYGLLMSATQMGRRDLIEIALALRPVAAADLYREFMREPESPEEQALQQALNIYARNGMVYSPGQAAPPAKPVRMIIHLGATKTGSTALQHLLEDNRPALLRQGIWYPEVGLFWQADRPHKQAGHARFTAEAIKDQQELRTHLFNGLDLMPGHVHTVILSSEAFFLNAESARLAKHFQAFHVEMIVYLRRQDEWANSQYAEFVAGGAINSTTLLVRDWLKTPMAQFCLNYDQLVQAWEQYLPKSSIHVRRYLRQPGNDWDIIADFVAVTGLKAIADLPPVARKKTNEARLSGTHVELIRQFNRRHFPNRAAYLSFIERVGSALEAWRRDRGLEMPSPWLLTDDVADQIMAAAAAGNDRLAADYHGLLGADLFPPRIQAPPDCPVYRAEIALIEAAYESVLVRKEAIGRTRETLVNYGLASWRLWLSVPLLAVIYRHQGRRDLADELSADPAGFAKQHWATRHPHLRWLAVSNASTLGPRQLLRIWLPLLRPLVRLRGGNEAVTALTSNPVLFMRSLRSPLARAIGRIMFPMGEKC
jgi:capsular polysaccharide export protein